MKFNDILTILPTIDHLAAIELFDGSNLVARIDNKPGSAGSVRVYNALHQQFGVIDTNAATKGLQLYAEHTDDAIVFPGKHPNIDRLLSLIQDNMSNDTHKQLSMNLIAN